MTVEPAELASLLPFEALVPEPYARWRPFVRDAMQFVVLNLSAERATRKALEQALLPPDTAPARRLGVLIARMPGLQKLGQLLARNRHIDPAVRGVLIELENGIRDASVANILGVLEQEHGSRLAELGVRTAPELLAEATVSAVVRFTARDGIDGVFKVLKPRVREWFEEDIEILQGLTTHIASSGADYGFAAAELAEMLADIRLLLMHELDFPREQKTLREMEMVFGRMPGVRLPRVIEPLSTTRVTAMTYERGVKVTDAHIGSRFRRARVAEQLIETLIAAPLLSGAEEAVFHADPHAGNLLYDEGAGELVILDWALAERLTREQRAGFTAVVLGLGLRSAAVISEAVRTMATLSPAQNDVVNRKIEEAMRRLPWTRLAGSMDAVQLLDDIALAGVPFPAPLLLFRKMLFTLDGVLHEIAGEDVSMDAVLFRQALAQGCSQAWCTVAGGLGNYGPPWSVPQAG